MTVEDADVVLESIFLMLSVASWLEVCPRTACSVSLWATVLRARWIAWWCGGAVWCTHLLAQVRQQR